MRRRTPLAGADERPRIVTLSCSRSGDTSGQTPPRTLTSSATLSCLLIFLSGCGSPKPAPPVQVEPHVRLARAELRTIVHEVGQPGVIDAYEQTALYAKVSGYIQKWNVDIGARIKTDQVLAEISVPELDAEYQEKKAQAHLDEVQIQVAEQMVEVATSNCKAAGAQVKEAQANIGKYQAAVERWESEVQRLGGLSGEGVVNRQVLEESRKQLKADTAAREAARATFEAAQANELARKADVDKAKVDVKAARARAAVSAADQQRIAALVGYTRIIAPYGGIVVVRNVNKGDYLQPGSGDLTSGKGTPLYVVARTDLVRVYVDVPEMDANAVHGEEEVGKAKATKATVRIQALDDTEIEATVTRTSWALRERSRSLRAEIDLPNPDARLLPGMYAYGEVRTEKRNVRAIPAPAVVEIGNRNYCFLYEDGKAVQTAVQTGTSDGKWTEVIRKRQGGKWVPFTGDEKVILGDLAELSNGEKVQVANGQAHQR
jgi:HlyD family secretion protein